MEITSAIDPDLTCSEKQPPIKCLQSTRNRERRRFGFIENSGRTLACLAIILATLLGPFIPSWRAANFKFIRFDKHLNAESRRVLSSKNIEVDGIAKEVMILHEGGRETERKNNFGVLRNYSVVSLSRPMSVNWNGGDGFSLGKLPVDLLKNSWRFPAVLNLKSTGYPFRSEANVFSADEEIGPFNSRDSLGGIFGGSRRRLTYFDGSPQKISLNYNSEESEDPDERSYPTEPPRIPFIGRFFLAITSSLIGIALAFRGLLYLHYKRNMVATGLIIAGAAFGIGGFGLMLFDEVLGRGL